MLAVLMAVSRQVAARLVPALLALALFIGAAMATALITVHTDWGRERLRRRVEAAIDAVVVGDVRIRRIDGSIFGDLIIHDLQIDSPEGRPAIVVHELRMDLALLPLMSKTARFESLRADGLAIHGHRDENGQLDLGRLLVPSDEPTPWDVVIDELEIARGTFRMTSAAGDELHIDDLALRGGIELLHTGERKADLVGVGTWRERKLPVELAVDLEADQKVVDIATAELSSSGAVVSAREVRIADGQVTGELEVSAPASAIATLLPDGPLRGGVELRLRAAAGDAEGETRVAIDGGVGGAAVNGALTVEPRAPRAAGSLRFADLDLSAVLTGGVPTDLHGGLAFDLAIDRGQPGFAAVRGDVDLTAGGRIRGTRIQRAHLAARTDDGRAEVSFDGRGAGGLVATARGTVVVGTEAVVIERLQAHVRARDLAALDLAGDRPVGGAVRAEVTASGRLGGARPHLAVNADLHGRHLVYDRVRLQALDIGARTRNDGAIAVSVASWPPGERWRIDVDALVRLAEDRVRIDLGEHRLKTQGVPWRGRGGRITIEPERVELRDLTTHVAGGSLTVGGDFRRAGERAGDLSANVSAGSLDLQEVARSLDLPPEWRGRLDGRVAVQRRGRHWLGRVHGGGTGLVMRARAEPVDVHVDARLAPRRAAVDAHLSGRSLGRADVALQVDPPADYLRAPAWKRLPRSAIRSGKVDIAALDLRALAAVAGIARPIAGRVDGQLVLHPHGSHGWLRTRGVTAPELPAPIDSDLRLEHEGRLLRAELDVMLRGLVAGQVTARVREPVRPFDPASWAALDADDVRGATVRIDEALLTPERSRRLRLPERMSGRGSLRMVIGPGLRTAELDARVTDLVGGPLRRPVSTRIEVSAGDDGLRGRMSARAGGGHLQASGRVPVTLADLWHDGMAALRRAPVEADVKLHPTPVRGLLALTGRQQPVVGTVSAIARVGGTLAEPTGRAEATLREFGVRTPSLRELRARAAWDGALLKADVRGRQRDGGRLAIDATIDPARPEEASGRLQARGFDLEPLARLAPPRWAGVQGLLAADVEVAGLGRETADIDGQVRLTRAAVPVDSRIGTLRDGTVTIGARDGRITMKAYGMLGDGAVRVDGTGVTRGLVPQRADVDVRLKDVVLLAELQPEVDARLHVSLRRTGDRWRVLARVYKGKIDLPRLGTDPLYERGAPDDMVIIENGRPPARAVVPEPAWKGELGKRPTDPYLRARLDIEPVTVHSKELRGRLVGTIIVAVGDDGIFAEGTVSITEGMVTLFDRQYRIEHARVHLNGGKDPQVDIRLFHDFPGLTLYVAVTGPVREPKLQLSSRPGTYSEGQLLGFLLGGEPGQDRQPELRDTATSVAAGLISRKIGGYVQDYLPVELDVLRFETATARQSATFTVGKWITRKFFLGYERRLEARPDENAGEAELEYWLRPDLLIEGAIGDRGHHDVDLLWLERW